MDEYFHTVFEAVSTVSHHLQNNKCSQTYEQRSRWDPRPITNQSIDFMLQMMMIWRWYYMARAHEIRYCDSCVAFS